MNSHQRRVCDRYWLYAVYIPYMNYDYDGCIGWLERTFGSPSFKRRTMPVWCFRPEIEAGPNFTEERFGTTVFFRREKYYTAFLLRWA